MKTIRLKLSIRDSNTEEDASLRSRSFEPTNRKLARAENEQESAPRADLDESHNKPS